MNSSQRDNNRDIKMTSKNKRIVFLLEDNPAYRLVIKVVLEKMGFIVMQFENGRKASEMIHHIKPVLIISDIDMPEMNGFQFFEYVQDNSDEFDLPFLFISSTASNKKRKKASKLSAFKMLDKPVSPHELENAINEIIGTKVLVEKN